MDKQKELPEWRSCENCGNSYFSTEAGKAVCNLDGGKRYECIKGFNSLWEPDGIVVTVDAEWLGQQIAHIIFNQCKAKFFNVLESQLENGSRLMAAKNITADIIRSVSKDAESFIIDVLADWQEKLIAPDEAILTEDEEAEAIKEYEETKEALK